MLRTDLFKTVDRAETRFIAVRDALTHLGDPHDISRIDASHCKQGRLGVGWHFFVLGNGNIQLGRNIETCGSHTKGLDTLSVAIGVEGGTDKAGDKELTRTAAQWSAIEDLIEFLSNRYPSSEVSDQYGGHYPTP